MKIIDKIKAKQTDMRDNRPVTVAFLGDSVTQGCFECYKTGERSLETVFDYKSAYSTRFKEILNLIYPSVQINVINSGISGDNAAGGLARLKRDVSAYNPDLCVVSFGLNDSAAGDIERYKNSLEGIFSTLAAKGTETIFLTQNFMCEKTSAHLTDDFFIELSKNFSKIQNDGILKEYMNAAKELCKKYGVRVCDLYSVWEELKESGADVTELLANKLNHPVREYHYYIAIKLIETILGA